MILYADRLLVGDRNTIIEDGALRIKDGVIQMVGTRATVTAAYPDDKLIAYHGCTLMPGMIDLHVHLAFPPSPSYNDPINGVSLRALFAAGQMRDTLAAGVTTIRDSGSAYGIGTAIKRAAKDGYIMAPRIFACLQGICMTGGHGTALPDIVIEADGVNEVKKAVRHNLKLGADCIKVLTSEGYRGQELDQEELDAAVREAHRFGVKIAAHAGYGDSLEMCLKAGFDSIEHGTHLTVEQARYMKEHDITWVPTIYVFNYVYEQVCKLEKAPESMLGQTIENMILQKPYLADCVKAYRDNVRKLYDTGVRVATGTDTDCAYYRGAPPVAMECAHLVNCGLSPMEAIECATKNGADYLGMGDSLGQLREGFIADVIAVSGNPAENIEALQNIYSVYQSGKKVVG